MQGCCIVYVFQSYSGDRSTEELLDILSRFTDDSLLPAFYQALVESGHRQVAQMLGYAGLLVVSLL